jgi:hypothetical protein
MKISTSAADKIEEGGAPADPGYDAWKRQRIERAKAQAEDRQAMIPAEQVWRDLGLER